MNISVNYFGSLTEVTGCSTETVEFYGNTIEEFLEELTKKYPSLETKDFQVAQNKVLVNKKEPLNGEEIALLPPFSGG